MASQADRACLSRLLSVPLIVDAPKGDLDELGVRFSGEENYKLRDPEAKLPAGCFAKTVHFLSTSLTVKRVLSFCEAAARGLDAF